MSILFKARCALDYKVIIPIVLLIKKATKSRQLKVNIGGGNFSRWGWLNLDYISPSYPYSSAMIDHNFDLMSGEKLPFLDNSVDVFYSSNCLEHLCQGDVEHVIAELYRCMKPGALVRLATPSYDHIYEHTRELLSQSPQKAMRVYLNAIAAQVADTANLDEFISNFNSLSREDLADFYTARVDRDKQRQSGENHCNWFNHTKFTKLLAAAGFTDITPSSCYESRHPDMRGAVRFLGLEKLCSLSKIVGFDEYYDSPNKRCVFIEAVK